MFGWLKKAEDQPIQKSASENVTRRPTNIELGSEALQFLDDLAEVTMPFDLTFPQRLKTFDKMVQNPTIQVGLYLDRMYTSKAFRKPKFSHSSNPESKAAAEFLEYVFNTMEKPLSFYVREAVYGYRKDGFAIHQKVYKRLNQGEYAGRRGIKKLSWRDLRSLDGTHPFVYVNGGRDISHIRQTTEAFKDTSVWNNFPQNERFSQDGYIDIPYWRCIIYGEDFSSSNPLGFTPLISCYKDWKKLHLINELETSGVTKDMAGLLEIKIPEDILARAKDDPKGKDAAFVRKYMRDAANIHQGKQTFIMSPSDTFDSTSIPKYSMNLKGIDGGY